MTDIRSFLAWPGAPLAIGSAALFGASTPLAKALLGEGVGPWLLAGLLYLGSGLGLAVVHYGRRILQQPSREAPLARGDWGWMALVVVSGGVAGPVLLMLGLTTTPASSAALLLNLEGLADPARFTRRRTLSQVYTIYSFKLRTTKDGSSSYLPARR